MMVTNSKKLISLCGLALVGVYLAGCQGQQQSNSTEGKPSEAVDVSQLKSADGQLLVLVDDSKAEIPARPADPSKLPESDPLHWWDMEFAGWKAKKENMPTPPAGGAKGKKVVCLKFIDHPYLTAYTTGMKKVADAYGINLETKVANNDNNLQAQQVDEVIAAKPDLVILSAVDASAAVALVRKLNRANIPVIASNKLIVDDGMKYVLCWTGPDDWGQFRILAQDFAKRLNSEGGYCIIRHFPGGSPFFSRTFAPITELKKIAPKMEMLDMQGTNLDADKTMQVVADWVTRFGPKLKGIISADDGQTMTGAIAALKKAGRKDVIIVAAGNSKVGMDFLKSGELHAITYQSAESDGALPMKIAGDWLNGKPIDKPVYYLPKKIITKENVDQFMPAQW